MPYTVESMAFEKFPFYNLDAGVGSCRGNLRGDVLFVQFLLRNVYDHPMGIIGRPAGTLDINGKFDPATGSYILAFQKAMARLGRAVKGDGQIDPAPRDWPLFETSTLWWLEHLYHELGYADPKYEVPPGARGYLRLTVIETHGGGV